MSESASENFCEALRNVLRDLGEDPDREGLRDTPARVHKALVEMTRGIFADTKRILSTRFESDADQMICVHGIPFTSLCEHHLLPFSGFVDVAYIPRGQVVGLSKIPRVVRAVSQRLQIQERMAQDIAQAMLAVSPDVAVFVSAEHQCMIGRGIRSQGNMGTAAIYGKFKESEVRAEWTAHRSAFRSRA